MSRVSIVVTALLMVACASRRPIDAGFATSVSLPPPATTAPPVLGTRADVRTHAGAFAGYTVDDRCRDADCFGVHGTGSQFFPGLRPWDRPLSSENADRWRNHVMAELRGLSSIHTTGYARACDQPGLVLWINDWREVDAALARIGAMLTRDDLQETVGVCIEAAIHPELVGR